MTENAIILADSISAGGHRLTTFLLPRYPKPLFGQLSKHRALSMSAASSRAIPLERLIASVEADPWLPTFTKAQKGMGGEPITDKLFLEFLTEDWLEAKDDAVHSARRLEGFGVAKEVCNRLIEPFARMPVVITATEWDNFFALRTHEGAQADFRETALEMQLRMSESVPRPVQDGHWHIPFSGNFYSSVAACARCSYANHEGGYNFQQDKELVERLKASQHMTPFEHQASPKTGAHANYRGWQSLRTGMGY